MILTTDVAYQGDRAAAAGILHPDWHTDRVARTITKKIDRVAAYEPGAFYKRELPCILSLFDDPVPDLEAIIVDGFVDLGGDGRPGLGRHLFEALGGTTPVVGVAKSAFAGTPAACQVFRGRSKTPLYVTAAGMALEEAKSRILGMYGRNRIPGLLRRADQACRAALED